MDFPPCVPRSLWIRGDAAAAAEIAASVDGFHRFLMNRPRSHEAAAEIAASVDDFHRSLMNRSRSLMNRPRSYETAAEIAASVDENRPRSHEAEAEIAALVDDFHLKVRAVIRRLDLPSGTFFEFLRQNKSAEAGAEAEAEIAALLADFHLKVRAVIPRLNRGLPWAFEFLPQNKSAEAEAEAKIAALLDDFNLKVRAVISGLDRRPRAFKLLLQNKSAEAEVEFASSVDDFNPYLKAGAAIYWGRAKARLDQAKYDGCVEDSKKAIELDGSVWNPYLYAGTAYFHQKRYDEARSVLLMGVDLAPNNRSDFDNIISKLDEALVAGNAGSVLAGNGDTEPMDLDPEHADPVAPVEQEFAVDVLPHAEVVVNRDQFIPLCVKTLTPSDINKALVIYRDVSQGLFDEAMDRGVLDAHTNTFPIHLINGAGGEITETVMNRADNRCRVNWKGFLALNPELIAGQRVVFSKQWVQVLGVATLMLMVVPV